MAEINQNEYIDTSEFLEPEDSMEISSDFTDITPIKKTVIIRSATSASASAPAAMGSGGRSSAFRRKWSTNRECMNICAKSLWWASAYGTPTLCV